VSDNSRGAALMMAGTLAFLLNDTLMKSLSGDLPVFQALALRGLIAAALMLPWVRWQRVPLWGYTRADGWRVALRALAEAISAGLYIAALFHLPIANATAILAALPLAVTLAGAAFLREPVGWRRLAAILVGLVGVLLVVRPGSAGFDVWSLVALASVLTITLRELLTRSLSTHVPSFAVAFWTALGVALVCFAAALVAGEWGPLSPAVLTRLPLAAVFLVGGYVFSVMAMRVGDLAAVSPFRYTSIVFAMILGFLAFGEFPDGLTLAGAALISGAGAFTLWRERRVSPRPPPPIDLRVR